MRKVYIVGHLKDENGTRDIDWEGYMQGKCFYPDAKNVRMFYKVVRCHLDWDKGIYAKHIEDLEE